MNVDIKELRALRAKADSTPWTVQEYDEGVYEGGTSNADYIVALVNAADALLSEYEFHIGILDGREK